MTMGPPAEILYAVEPVGVATIIPSAAYRLRNWPLIYIEKYAIFSPLFRDRMMSLNAASR